MLNNYMGYTNVSKFVLRTWKTESTIFNILERYNIKIPEEILSRIVDSENSMRTRNVCRYEAIDLHFFLDTSKIETNMWETDNSSVFPD